MSEKNQDKVEDLEYQRGWILSQGKEEEGKSKRTDDTDKEVNRFRDRDYETKLENKQLVEKLGEELKDEIPKGLSIFPKEQKKKILTVLGVLGGGVAINVITKLIEPWIPILK